MMAQLLVMWRDNEGSREGAYKRGDVVGVFGDDHEFGRKEQVYPFRVIRVAGDPADLSILVDGEPRTIRDDYPASMLRIQRLHRAMRRNATKNKEPFRRRRAWSVAGDGTITRKPIGKD